MTVIDKAPDCASVTSSFACESSQSTMSFERSEQSINGVIKDYLQRHSIPDHSNSWIIKKSELGGFGVFAKRDMDAGDIVFIDHPVILGPRAGLSEANFCVNCLAEDKSLSGCEKNCGLKVCSQKCRQSDNHQKDCKIISQWISEDSDLGEISKKMIKCLTPVRSLLLSNEDKHVVQHLKAHMGGRHGFEVQVLKEEMKLNIKEDEESFMRFVCAVLDANAFEVGISNGEKQSLLRGLYPLGGLANHCCVPNTFHVFDEDRRMVVRASVFIPEGHEIFHCYTRMIWSTLTRRYHLLRTKHFLCKCRRCCDPTESRTYMGALKCRNCGGNVLPVDSLKLKTKWQCDVCGDSIDDMFVSSRMSILGSTLGCLKDTDVRFMLKFLFDKLPSLVSQNNQVILETEYKLIRMLGSSQNFKWHELSSDLLAVKERMCKHILSILETLGAGWTKMRGLLLYEIYCCRKWKEVLNNPKQSENVTCTQEMGALLSEAAEILMYDVGAPAEIQSFWKQNNLQSNAENCY